MDWGGCGLDFNPLAGLQGINHVTMREDRIRCRWVETLELLIHSCEGTYGTTDKALAGPLILSVLLLTLTTFVCFFFSKEENNYDSMDDRSRAYDRIYVRPRFFTCHAYQQIRLLQS